MILLLLSNWILIFLYIIELLYLYIETIYELFFVILKTLFNFGIMLLIVIKKVNKLII